VDQYDNFTDIITQVRVNGNITQSENVADITGYKLGYNAYQKFVEVHGQDPFLPGLNFTQNQLFWISAAQQECKAYSPGINIRTNIWQNYTVENNFSDYLKKLTEIEEVTSTHAPPSARVLVSFGNLKDFSKDFQCQKKSRMNPTQKCEIW